MSDTRSAPKTAATRGRRQRPRINAAAAKSIGIHAIVPCRPTVAFGRMAFDHSHLRRWNCLPGLVFESNRRAAEAVDQEVSTSSRPLAYKDPSLQKLRVSVIRPCCGMMACAATGAEVRSYDPVNL